MVKIQEAGLTKEIVPLVEEAYGMNNHFFIKSNTFQLNNN